MLIYCHSCCLQCGTVTCGFICLNISEYDVQLSMTAPTPIFYFCPKEYPARAGNEFILQSLVICYILFTVNLKSWNI